MANIEFLLEAVNYEQMFEGMFNVFEGDNQNKVKQAIHKEIKKAKATLKKQDRVTWYLKVLKKTIIDVLDTEFDKDKNRLYTTGLGVFDFDDDEERQRTKERFEKYFKKEIKKLNDISIENSIQSVQQTLPRLEHYLSLPIGGIQNYSWKTQSIDDVLSEFERLEREWKKDSKELIPVDEDDEIIMKMGDYYWVDLEKAYCSKEGDAMGHCGNSPRSGENDTIYSLRQLKKFGNKKYWHPHVTVTLDEDLMVWEVKGRGNDKPADKYIPYVVELFSNGKYVKGQRTGVGYLPENNLYFEDDFTEEQQEKVKTKNPQFEIVEREPIKMVLDEYDLPAFVFFEDFDYGQFTNRPIENGEDMEEVLQNDPELNIANFNKLIDEGLSAYLVCDYDCEVRLETFMNYIKEFMETNRSEVVQAIADLFEDQYNVFINYLDNEIDKEIEGYIDEEFDEFDWTEDTLDAEDKEKMLDKLMNDWDYFLEDYYKRQGTKLGDKVIEYLEELDYLFPNGEEPYNPKHTFYDVVDDGEEFISNRMLQVIKEKKREALGDDYEEGDEKSQAEIDKELGQLEFDFGESLKPKWRNLVIM
jgi:hypothetical protein